MITLFPPLNPIKASLAISGSKSISNRVLILNEVLKTNRVPENLSDSEDTVLLINALKQIQSKKSAVIDIHHAGTDMRFLTALLCVTEGTWTLTGSDRMKQRPVGELVNALRNLGAEISYPEKENFPPLQITGKKLAGGKLEMDGSISSQFISAVLLIAPAFANGLELKLKNNIVSRPYIDMTISLLKQFGINITESDNTIAVTPSSIFHLPSSSSIQIESDWSSASYWYSICALSEKAEIELKNYSVNSWQADSILPKLYKELGVHTEFKKDSIVLSRKERNVPTFKYDFTACPDIAQTIAVTCAGLGIAAELTGLQTLKIKETDRIIALKKELEKTGVPVQATDHSLQLSSGKITGSDLPLHFSTYNDHRMAMSFAPLALVYPGLQIDEHEVVYKSYIRFWEDLQSVGFNVHLQP